MFTGLTSGTGVITGRVPRRGEQLLSLRADFDWDSPLISGESISVSGACLTVTGIEGGRGFTALASEETLTCSTLGQINKVNLERALTLGDRLGGHLVSGHVDGIGRVANRERVGSSLRYTFTASDELLSLVVAKGSITIDGVSLTVNEVGTDFFTVNLIPHTAEMTTLATLNSGDEVNLETDLLAKYVQRLLQPKEERPKEKLSRDFLARHGF